MKNRLKKTVKQALSLFGYSPRETLESLYLASLKRAINQQGLSSLVMELENIVPDITEQYTTSQVTGEYVTKKVRGLHAFQVRLMEKAVRMQSKKKMNVVDIGDSAGTHLIYLKSICKEIEFRTISVNLDKNAVEKIRGKGMEAIHCAAENLNLGEEPIDLFTSFEMVEHLMNPAIFFHRIAVKGKSDYFLMTVPYREVSTVGMWTYRPIIKALIENREDLSEFIPRMPKINYAEDEHIFELSPIDWKLLLLFSGWKPIYDEIYFQYPKSSLLTLTKPLWKETDFEGFWGVILKRDLTFSNIYQDWGDMS